MFPVSLVHYHSLKKHSNGIVWANIANVFLRRRMKTLRKLIREEEGFSEDDLIRFYMKRVVFSCKKLQELEYFSTDYYNFEDFQDILPALTEFRYLKRLKFSFENMDEGFQSLILHTTLLLNRNPSLKSFVFETTGLERENEEYFLFLKFLQKCSRLNDLRLDFTSSNIGDQVLHNIGDRLAAMNSLRAISLGLQESEVMNEGLSYFVRKLKDLPNLNTLLIKTDMGMYADSPEIFKTIAKYPALKNFHFKNYAVHSLDSMQIINTQLSKLTLLRNLSLKFVGAGLKKFEIFEFCKGLAKMSLLKDLALTFSCPGFSCNKTLLYLTNSFQSLTALEGLILYISDRESIKGEEVEAFCIYLRKSSLKVLKLTLYNNLSGQILSLAEAIASLKSLQNIYLRIPQSAIADNKISEFVLALEFVIFNKNFHFNCEDRAIYKSSAPSIQTEELIKSFSSTSDLSLILKGSDLNTHLILAKLNIMARNMKTLTSLKIAYSNSNEISNPYLQEIGKILPNFPLLKTLELDFNKKSLTDPKALIEIFNGIITLKDLNKLVLEIRENDFITDDQIFNVGKMLAKLLKLESLEFTLTETKEITAYGLSYLYKCVSYLQNLKSLNLNLISSNIHDMSYIAWEEFTTSLGLMKKLEELDVNMSQFKNLNEKKLVDLTQNIKNLISLKVLKLKLNYTGKQDALESFMEAFSELKALENLDLLITNEDQIIDDNTIKNLSRSLSGLQELRVLKLKISGSSKITDFGCQVLLETLSKLKWLCMVQFKLPENKLISTVTLEFISTLFPRFQELSTLVLEFTDTDLITAHGIQSFYTSIPKAPKLSHVTLEVTRVSENFTLDTIVYKTLVEKFGADNFLIEMPVFYDPSDSNSYVNDSSDDDSSDFDADEINIPVNRQFFDEPPHDEEISKDLDAYYNIKKEEEQINIIPGAHMTMGYRFRRYQTMSIASSVTDDNDDVFNEE